MTTGDKQGDRSMDQWQDAGNSAIYKDCQTAIDFRSQLPQQ